MKKTLLFNLLTLLLLVFTTSAFSQTIFLVESPTNLAGSYDFTDSFTADGWGADLDTTAVSALGAFAYDDGSYVDPVNGASGDSATCGPVINGSEVDGKVAFLYRGACNFSLKAYQAQAAGAVGCVIINNEPGNLINMLAGDSAEAIHIPVIFISDADGALLRDSIMDGGTTVFIGNPNGVFTNNVGAYTANISTPNSLSIPTSFAQSSSDFAVPVGAWVFNYGSADATNVLLNAVIDRDGTEVFNESSTGASILPGDSLYIDLGQYSENGYEAGFYTISYSIVADEADDFPVNNELSSSFWINEEGIYSKSRVDPTDGPIGANGLRPAESVEYEWCIAMQSENAEDMQITGMTFNTLTNDIDLTGQAVQLAVYEWNDPISGGSVSFDDLNEITDNEFYDYATDAQGEFVTVDFASPLELVNDQKYLACATIFIDEMFLGVDGGVDYSVAYDNYLDEVFFPLHDIDGGTWFPGGFGTDNVPALIVNLQLANDIADQVQALDIKPYPNPTVDMVNIPFGSKLDGTAMLEVFSVDGKRVHSEELCLKSTNVLSVDVTNISAGLHTFNLTFEDNSSTSFQVVIAR